MSVPDAAVNFLLENLSQVLMYNYSLVANVQENILKLQQELQALKGLLKDFSDYNQDSEYLKSTVNDIRRILGEAEDAVDTYVLQAAVQKSRNWASKAFHQITDYPIVLRDVGRQIAEVGVKIKELNDGKVKNSFEALQFQAIKNLDRSGSAEAPKVEEEHVIGFEGASEAVEKLLTGGPETLEVVSIIGMLGLGKTTLAKMVYKDPDVDYEFMIRAFVYVSQDFDKKEVLLKILASFMQNTDEASKLNVEQLENYLRQQLEGKQYLIVMDDVWEKEHWDRFKDAFPKNNKRCRVLITTRHEHVAKHANPRQDSVYRLDFLGLEACRELLRWRVFHENRSPRELQQHEVEIATKCDGLPLAVVVIAGILVNRPEDPEWWKDVAHSVKDYIARDTEQTTKVIEIMYRHLPNYLKPCFLYLGVFREDFEIPAWKLLRLWISEGLIQQEGDLNLEDMAEEFLEELVYRNLVMVGQRRANDRIKTCRMHDTLREFAKKEAMDENLFQEIKKNTMDKFLSGNPILDTYRRLCINNANVVTYISGIPSGKCVRSFLSFVKEETAVEPKLVSIIPKTFKLLRVLEIQSLIFTRFPVDLCNLVLLKYIAISSNFSSLPSSLSALFNLQTLIVNTTSRFLDIKADIWKMPQFRHLHTNAATGLPSPSPKGPKCKEGVSSKNIQTLCTISPESCRKEVFNLTPKLRKLGICGALTKLFEVNGESSLLPYLRKLESLQNLKLLNDDISNKLYSLPSKSSFPPSLTKLTLLNTLLDWKEMRTLGDLENLEVLKLKEYAFQGKLWQTEKGGFRRLKHLYIGHTDLVVWEASVDHFPRLKSLELNGCDKLQAIPHGLADISTLQLVVLHCTNPQVASSARKLHVLRLEQAKKGNKINSVFKVSVYPPEH